MTRFTLMTFLMIAGLAGCSGHGPSSIEFLDSATVTPRGVVNSEAVRIGDTLYISGMIGLKPHSLELVPGGIEAESRRTMDNLRMILEAHGSSMDDVAKCTVMLMDMSDSKAFNEIYTSYFKDDRKPARSALGVTGLPLNARVEVDCIAVISEN